MDLDENKTEGIYTVCAWCKKTISGVKPKDPKAPISHGICKNCAAEWEKQAN